MSPPMMVSTSGRRSNRAASAASGPVLDRGLQRSRRQPHIADQHVQIVGVRVSLQPVEVVATAFARQSVVQNDPVAFAEKVMDKVRTNEARPASHEHNARHAVPFTGPVPLAASRAGAPQATRLTAARRINAPRRSRLRPACRRSRRFSWSES